MYGRYHPAVPGSQVAPGGRDRAERAALTLRRAWALPLWSHVLCLVLLLAAASPFLRLSDAFTIDEGAYGVQVRDLDRGSWEFSYLGERADPTGRWLPLYNPSRNGGRSYAYVKQPAYPVAVLVATRLAGDVVGMHLLAMLGALGVAIAAWLVAAEIDPAASRGAFWLAAAGPVAVNAYLLWAHAPSAAMAGFATLAGLRLAKRITPLRVGALVACVAAGVLLRAEGLLFAGALALGLLLVGLRRRPWVARLGLPAACVAVAAGTVALEARWRGSIVGGSYSVPGLRGDDASPIGAGGGGLRRWFEGRVEGAWNSLLQGSLGDRRSAMYVATALALVVFAAWAGRRRRRGWQRDVGLALAAAGLLYAARLRIGGTQPMTGLLAAWPAVVLGMGLVPRRGARAARTLIVVAGIFAAAVLGSQYRVGGGREWGGRFLFPAMVLVAVLSTLGIRHLLHGWGRWKGGVTILVVGLVVIPTFTGLGMVRTSRGQAAAIVDEVASGDPRLVVTHVSGLPPFAWKVYPELGWMAVPPGEFQEATSRLRDAGFRDVTLLGPGSLRPGDLTSYPSIEDITGPEARQRGWRTFRLSVGP